MSGVMKPRLDSSHAGQKKGDKDEEGNSDDNRTNDSYINWLCI